jgi:hypothetical protein
MGHTEAGSYRQAVQRSKRHSSSSQQVRAACVPCRPLPGSFCQHAADASRASATPSCKRAPTHGTAPARRHSKQKTAAAAITHRPSGASHTEEGMGGSRGGHPDQWSSSPAACLCPPQYHHAALHTRLRAPPSERERNGFSTHQRIPIVPAHLYSPHKPVRSHEAAHRHGASVSRAFPAPQKRPTPPASWAAVTRSAATRGERPVRARLRDPCSRP